MHKISSGPIHEWSPNFFALLFPPRFFKHEKYCICTVIIYIRYKTSLHTVHTQNYKYSHNAQLCDKLKLTAEFFYILKLKQIFLYCITLAFFQFFFFFLIIKFWFCDRVTNYIIMDSWSILSFPLLRIIQREIHSVCVW